MSGMQLIAHFDRLSEVPNAISRLRRFILDLAVRGKLVDQDPNDEPATSLLSRIREERARLIKAGRMRGQEALSPIERAEVPFRIPQHWALVRLGDALELINGRAFRPSEWSKDGLPIIRIQNLNNTDAPFNYCAASIPDKFFVQAGDFLISWSGTPGTSFGAHIWDRGPALLNQHIFRAELIGEAFFPPFLRLAVNSRLMELINQAQGGVGLQHVTKPKLERIPLTLPPFAEQHRIVARVDELMALCDRLEEARVEREGQRDRLVEISLQSLGQAVNVNFREHASFHLRHLSSLTTLPEHIEQLRQVIFNLAVHGQLGPVLDWPKKPVRLCEFAAVQNGYAFKSEWFAHSGIRLLRNANVGHGAVRWEDVVFLPEKRSAEFERFRLNLGDIVLSLDRPFISTGTKVARIRAEDLPSLLLQRVGRFQLSAELSPDYIFLWLNSPHFCGQLTPGRSNGVPHISSKQVENAEIFVPSLGEQHRIVAKVDELMVLCDGLEKQLTTIRDEGRILLEAVLCKALSST